MKISVAICTYNGEKYIKEQLESIVRQHRVVDEIIMGDDGSTDSTINIAKKELDMSGIPYKIFQNKENVGVSANFENIIRKCTGDIILTADQDDVWFPEKVETIEKYFENNPSSVLVFSDGIVTDRELKPIGDLWKSVHFTKRKEKLFEQSKYYEVLLSDNVITGAAMSFRKSLVDVCLPIEEKENILHDYWFALSAPVCGEIGLIKKPLFLYRQHGENVVGVKSNSLINKAKRWIKTARNNQSYCRKKYLSSIAFYSKFYQKTPKEQKELLRNWVEFNKCRAELQQSTRRKCIFKIVSNKINGNYKKFYDVKFAALQDLVACLTK